jgi:hypothetical protein
MRDGTQAACFAWHDIAVAPADVPPSQPSKPVALLWRLLIGAFLFGALGAAAGLFSGDATDGAIGGAFVGVLIGASWYWRFLRAQEYRGSFDPAGRTLTRPERAVTDTPPGNRPVVRRYRASVLLLALAVVSFAGFTTIAILAAGAPKAPAMIALFFWGMVALSGWFLWSVVFTYTEVGPRGLRVRTPTKVQAISWPELAEVRWNRDTAHDRLLFATVDGREIKSTGAVVTDEGFGQRRALRMLADIRKAWTQAHR